MPYETVVAELQADTVDVSAAAGVMGGRFAPGLIPQTVVVNIKVMRSVVVT